MARTATVRVCGRGFSEGGPQAVADHELLEMILFLGLPRWDTKSIAGPLLAE